MCIYTKYMYNFKLYIYNLKFEIKISNFICVYYIYIFSLLLGAEGAGRVLRDRKRTEVKRII